MKPKCVFLDKLTLGESINLSPITDIIELKCYDTTPPDLRAERIEGFDIVITNKVVFDNRLGLKFELNTRVKLYKYKSNRPRWKWLCRMWT